MYQAPPRKPIHFGYIVAFVVVALIGLVGLFLWIRWAERDKDEAAAAARAFVSRLERADYHGAWESASPRFKQEHPEASFREYIEHQFPKGPANDRIEFRLREANDKRACLRGWLIRDESRGQTIAVGLKKTGSAWFVDDFKGIESLDCKIE